MSKLRFFHNLRSAFIHISLFLMMVASPFSIFAQRSVKPSITRSINSEKIRDPKIEDAILIATETNPNADQETRYYYNKVDLNGDKIPEVLVYLFGNSICGTGGCNALILQKVKDKYRLVTYFSPVRNPIIVSRNKTKGWSDLIFFNAGGGIMRGYYSVCRFNGKSYSDNPTVEEEALPLKIRVSGTAYVSGDGYGESGLKFLVKNKL